MKTYLPLPDFSTPPPDDGPLNLGHILQDLSYSSIQAPLNRDGHVTVPGRVQTDKRTGFRLSRQELLSGDFGIFAKFLAMFGVGVESSSPSSSSSSSTKSGDDMMTIDSLETIAFSPPREYIEQSMNDYRVRSRMRACGYREPVFMVTGMKMARGASLQSRLASIDQRSPLGFCTAEDVEYGGMPFVGGMAAGGRPGKSDFVLAVRLKKIYYKEGRMLTAEYHRGASVMDHITGEMYAVELQQGDDDVGLQDVPPGINMVLAGGNRHDGEEQCYLAFPKGF